MIQHFFKTSLFLLVLFFTCAFTNAYADSINGGWLASNGDLIVMVKSSKGNVMALDVTAEKKLRYVFTGTMTGDQLNLATRDGLTTLDATVAGNTFTAVITPASQAPQDLTAKLYFAFNGSGYDGMWKTDGKEEYLLYATFKVKGVVTVIVPYFSFNQDKTVAYNLFMGSPAVIDDNGNISFSGISMLDYSVLKLGFTSTSLANTSMFKGNKVTKFITNKNYAVTKKSGEF